MHVSVSNRRAPLALAVALLAPAGCATSSVDADDSAEPTSVEKFARRPAASEHPEIGRLVVAGGACAATLIRPNVLLTAAGCAGDTDKPGSGWETEGRTEPVSGKFTLLSRDGSTQVFEVDRRLSVADEAALLRLKTPVPEKVARPAALADDEPAWGEKVTWFGYGCDSGRSVRPAPFSFVWQGEEGACARGAGGATFGANAVGTTDVFRITPTSDDAWYGAVGDVTALRDVLDRQADAWAAPLTGVEPDEDAVEVELHMEAVPTPATVFEQVVAMAAASDPTQGEALMNLGESVLGELDWETIINLGKEVWQVIADNAPVVSIAYDYASALPKGVESPLLLSGFSDLQQQSWRVWGVNLFGMTVYDVTYTVVHQYGGSYEGRGKYLATVAVLPSNVDVLWGYTLDMDVSKVSVLNVGTSEEPVASVAMELSLKVRTVIKDHTSTQLFQFRGDSAEVISTPLD